MTSETFFKIPICKRGGETCGRKTISRDFSEKAKLGKSLDK